MKMTKIRKKEKDKKIAKTIDYKNLPKQIDKKFAIANRQIRQKDNDKNSPQQIDKFAKKENDKNSAKRKLPKN